MKLDRIHSNIRKAREQLNLSQSAMADELGIGRTTFINFETGKTNIFCKTLRLFAKYLDKTEEQLICGSDAEGFLLESPVDCSEREKALRDDYESRIARLQAELDQTNGMLSEAQQLHKTDQETIKSLTKTNDFLLSQLSKND